MLEWGGDVSWKVCDVLLSHFFPTQEPCDKWSSENWLSKATQWYLLNIMAEQGFKTDNNVKCKRQWVESSGYSWLRSKHAAVHHAPHYVAVHCMVHAAAYYNRMCSVTCIPQHVKWVQCMHDITHHLQQYLQLVTCKKKHLQHATCKLVLSHASYVSPHTEWSVWWCNHWMKCVKCVTRRPWSTTFLRCHNVPHTDGLYNTNSTTCILLYSSYNQESLYAAFHMLPLAYNTP